MSVTAAKGFLASSVAANIKYQDRPDMAMIYSKVPCEVAGVFTKNMVKAAPVVWDKKIVNDGEKVQVVVINAGIANACTGKEGEEACRKTAEYTADKLKLSYNSVLVASTGVIGMKLPINRICIGVEKMTEELCHSSEAGLHAAEAIMTTDTIKKECSVQITIGGKVVTIGGMCKGSGMIHPDMATMLAFTTTDVNIERELLQEALSCVVTQTFNMISVDRDTSTNDTYLVLANGLAENPKITTKNEDYQSFLNGLLEVSRTLAKLIAKDGEGATKLIEVTVKGCQNKEDAIALSKSVISSNLVKAAVFGSDANWGRILCALGYSGVAFQPEKIDLWIESNIGSIKLVENGIATDYEEEMATKILEQEEVRAIADLKSGDKEATAWGCDLTYDYVKINGDYRS